MDALRICGLCGFQFDPRGQGCRSSCPLSKGCGMTCCPRCRSGAPDEERGLAGMLKRALQRLGRSP